MSTELLKIPAEISFAVPEDVEAANQDAAPATFHIVANTGGRMSFPYGDVVIDMNGVKSKKLNIPILYGHDSESINAGIGHTTSISVQNGQIVLDGVVSRDTIAAREFVKSSRNGFPWQASVGGRITKRKNVKENETYNVNGRDETGPCIIASEFELWETSVVTFGADSATSSVAASAENNLKDEVKMSGELKSEISPVEVKKDEVKASDVAQMTQDVTASEIEKNRAEMAAEYERIAEIKARAKENDDALVAQAIREGWTPDKFEVASLRASRPSAETAPKPMNLQAESKTLEVIALRSSGLINESRYDEKTLEAADKIGNVGFQEFCEIACGKNLPRYRRSPSEWLHAAFSTQNLSYVLTRSFNAILLEAFYYTESEWRKVFNIGRVGDFKTYDRYRLNPVDFEFEPLTDGGKYKHGELGDSAYSVQAETFGKMYSITRKDIINDDMGVFSQIPKMIGFGASETLNRYCWTKFLNPSNDADGKSFYHADHGNLKTSCALSSANLSAARAQFLKQKKTKGGAKTTGESPLGIQPTRLVVPIEIEDLALMLTKATYFNNGATTDNPADYNPQKGRWEVVSSPYLSDSNFSGYSASTWYLFADPRRLAAFEISFLNGKDSPTIEKADADFDTEGIQFKGYLDFGISQQDYRAAMKCTA